jgi:DNA-binding CsgD family transcriptional regulator
MQDPHAFALTEAPQMRRSRAKRHIVWEKIERESHGAYTPHLLEFAVRYPSLTPMELRVCALIKARLSTGDIAKTLMIKPKTVENYRIKIRRKIGITRGTLARHISG